MISKETKMGQATVTFTIDDPIENDMKVIARMTVKVGSENGPHIFTGETEVTMDPGLKFSALDMMAGSEFRQYVYEQTFNATRDSIKGSAQAVQKAEYIMACLPEKETGLP